MNITIAIDSLKGSLSSLEAGHAIEEGIRRVYKDAAVNVRPLADGGEGTVEALACGMGGTLETVTAVSYTHLDVYKRQAFSQYWTAFSAGM